MNFIELQLRYQTYEALTVFSWWWALHNKLYEEIIA